MEKEKRNLEPPVKCIKCEMKIKCIDLEEDVDPKKESMQTIWQADADVFTTI